MRKLIKKVQDRQDSGTTIEILSAARECPRPLYAVLSSLSNQDSGGVLLFGLDAESEFAVTGVYDVSDLQTKVSEQCRQMEPVVQPLFTVLKCGNGCVVAAEIPPLDVLERPCYYKGMGKSRGSYVREGSLNVPMPAYRIYGYEAYRKRYQDDVRVNYNADMSAVSESALNSYLSMAEGLHPGLAHLPESDIKQFLGMTADGHPTLACTLLFSIYPQMLYPWYRIHAMVVSGDSADTESEEKVQERARRAVQEVMQKEAREVVQRGAPEVVRKEAREVVRRGAQEVVRKEPQEVVRRGAREVMRKEPQEVTRNGTQEVVRKGAQEEVRKQAQKGTREEIQYIVNQRLEGTIPEILNGISDFFNHHLKRKSMRDPDTGRRMERYEYPTAALKEAVLNALVHRDYSVYTQSMPVEVIVYKNRIEVRSPGGLYGRMSFDNLGKRQAEIRNPVLARTLEIMGIMKNRHSGIPAMQRELESLGMEGAVFSESENFFCVTFYNGEHEDAPPVDFTEEEKLLKFCEIPRGRKEIAEFLGMTTIFYVSNHYINPLVESGRLKMTIPSHPKSKNQKFYCV